MVDWLESVLESSLDIALEIFWGLRRLPHHPRPSPSFIAMESCRRVAGISSFQSRPSTSSVPWQASHSLPVDGQVFCQGLRGVLKSASISWNCFFAESKAWSRNTSPAVPCAILSTDCMVLCDGMLWYVMVWCGMLWYVMICYGMVWYDMVWYVCTHIYCHFCDLRMNHEWQWMTMNDNERQWMTLNANELQWMAINDNDNKWQWMTVNVNHPQVQGSVVSLTKCFANIPCQTYSAPVRLKPNMYFKLWGWRVQQWGNQLR